MAENLRLVFFVTEDWYFCSHRLSLALAAKATGYDVSVITRVRSHGELIESSGLKLIPIDLSRSGKNPLVELKLIGRLVSIYRKEQPDIVHHVALKPVLYGAIASYIARVPNVVNALAGLGFLFSSKSIKARFFRPFVMLFFRLLLNRENSRVILQNPDDVELMCRNGILSINRISLIRGSGVNVKKYTVKKKQEGIPVIVLASRMLWDKGVGEFVEAAKNLLQRGVIAKFVLVGENDSENPSSIPIRQLQSWKQEGVIEWWGHRDDMPSVFAESHIVCLPSYREGLPKVLLEAAASGCPIVATDVPGCREIVREGKNGLLVPLYDVDALAAALKMLIDSPELCKQMGQEGRKIVENEFSIDKVNKETLSVYEGIAR